MRGCASSLSSASRSCTPSRNSPATCISELRSAPDYRKSAAYRLNRDYTGMVEQVVREAIESGEFRADVNVRTVRDMIFGAIEHRTWAFLRGEGKFPLDGTAEEITSIVFRGMSASPDQP